MANTTIQLKYSNATATPVSLAQGETAYSNNSNKLFVGLSSGAIVAIGGQYYTGLIDAATNANTGNAIVKRDASGNFSAGTITATLSGNATTASAWQNARTIGVSGDATGTVSVDGSANANIPLTLSNSGVTAATYGGATQIPTFVVDAKGRLTSAANVSSPTTLAFAADSGTGTLTLLSETLTVVGRDGLTSYAVDSNNSILIDVDNTVVRTSGAQAIAGDLSVTGNLIVAGTQTFVNTSTVVTTDSLIKLGANNTVGDVVDIGFYGSSNTGSSVQYHGLVREGSGGTNAGAFYLFKNLSTDPTGNVVSYAGLTKADLYTNVKGGTVSGLASAIAIADGGTGATTFTSGQRVGYNGTNLVSIANTTTTVTGGLSTANTISSITIDSYGGVTAYTGAAIAIDTSQITSGTLGVTRGGTGAATFTSNGILFGNGTGALQVTAAAGTSDQTWSAQLLTVNGSGTPVWTTTLNGGTF